MSENNMFILPNDAQAKLLNQVADAIEQVRRNNGWDDMVIFIHPDKMKESKMTGVVRIHGFEVIVPSANQLNDLCSLLGVSPGELWDKEKMYLVNRVGFNESLRGLRS